MKFVLQGPVTDAESAWSLLADTDWMNRQAGNQAVARMELDDSAPGQPRIQGAMGSTFGFAMTFTELESSWVQGRYFRQERTFTRSPVVQTSYEVVLEPHPEGVRPRLTVEATEANVMLKPALALKMRALKGKWGQVMDGLPRPGVAPPATARSLRPSVQRALVQWSAAVDSLPITSAFERFALTARPMELMELRPFALADRWGLDRSEVLAAFLTGVTEGLFSLLWSVRCPLCCAQVESLEELSDLPESLGCPSCRVNFPASMDDTLEAIFEPDPSLRLRPREVFCTMFPAASPKMHAVAYVEPGQTRELVVPLHEGVWTVRAGDFCEEVTLQVSATEGASAFRWSPEGPPSSGLLRAGDVTMTFVNPTDHLVRPIVVNRDAAGDRVTAGRMATFPAFRRLFGYQTVGDASLGVRSVTILFTDLAGSVSFYRRVGDAPAFGYVHGHIQLLTTVVERFGGDVVKTIGDAVMAAFDNADAAVGCALSMMSAYDAWRIGRMEPSPALRAALNKGPALVVRSDASGLDFFGSTVNMAARAEGLADGGEIVWTPSVQDAPGVLDRLGRMGIPVEPFQAEVKGMAEPQQFYRLRLD